MNVRIVDPQAIGPVPQIGAGSGVDDDGVGLLAAAQGHGHTRGKIGYEPVPRIPWGCRRGDSGRRRELCMGGCDCGHRGGDEGFGIRFPGNLEFARPRLQERNTMPNGQELPATHQSRQPPLVGVHTGDVSAIERRCEARCGLVARGAGRNDFSEQRIVTRRDVITRLEARIHPNGLPCRPFTIP